MAEQGQAGIPMSYIKDGIVVLSFLASIAGVYVKVTEQVVRLEQKVAALEEKTKELKESNTKLIDVITTFNTQTGSNIERIRANARK